LEGTFLQSSFISQCFVYGHPLENNIVAIVAANEDNFKSYAIQNGIEPNIEDMCSNDGIVRMVLKDMVEVGKASKLRPYEFVKKIFISPTPFTVDQGILTPTFKLKRPQAKEFFNQQIDAMFEELAKEDKIAQEKLMKEEAEREQAKNQS